MAAVYGDRVQEIFTTTGTGSIALAGPVAGYQPFSSIVSNAGTCYYAATDGVNWEVGLGTYSTAGNALARTTILSSSNSNAAVNWATGTKTIWLDLPASVVSSLTAVKSVGPCITGYIPTAQTFSSNTAASMSISSGVASDASLTQLLVSGSPLSWNVTNGNAVNGYQGGTTLPNSSTIHFFVIAKSDLSGYGSFGSTSLTPTLPPGYSGGFYRRISSIPTNSSGVLLLAQGGTGVEGSGGSLHYGLNASILDIAVTNLNAFTQYTLSVPQGINVRPIWRYNMPTNGKAISIFSSILGTTSLPSFADSGWTAAPGFDTSFDSGTNNYVMPKVDGSLITDTAGRINALSTGASTALYFMTCGWEDFRR